MNERQRDLFLWVWSRRRARGRLNVALLGLGVGAAGGVLFALLLGTSEMLRVLAYAVPAFAFIGWLGADRVFAANERIYQTLLDSGARPPSEKPVMQASDRGPAVAVAIAALIIAGLIVALIAAVQMGAL